MINQKSITEVEKAQFSHMFGKPLYDSYCFSKIPATVSTLLTGKDRMKALPSCCVNQGIYDSVIVILLDGFGWHFFEKYSDHPFLQRFIQEGIASKLTTQFPSTTAAHVTTIHTGMEVGMTGIYEWFQYEPLLDTVIAPLLFSKAGDPVPSTLLAAQVKPEKIYPFNTIYQKMHQDGIESFLFHDAQISQSPYSQALGKGAHSCAYFNFSQGLRSLKELSQKTKTHRSYAFMYYAGIDSVGHRKGPTSPEFDAAVKQCLDQLENEWMKGLLLPGKTALIVTADHGMTSLDPKETIYLNSIFPKLTSLLDVQAPAGSCRDLFLHVKPSALLEAQNEISSLLTGKAEVWKTEDLIELGLFGKVQKRFLERVGNLVILPYEHEGVWWWEPHKFHQNFYGSHGGLTRKEMETIFLFLEIAK
jgi:predicted AlkP superfamily pyrophosphatase or phosphodiesterase